MDITGVTVPDRTPWRAWRALPRAVRKEVHRLAKAGHAHPDPAVARTALAWGRSVRRAAGWLRVAAIACLMAGFAAADHLRVGSRRWDLVASAPVVGIGAAGFAVLLGLVQRATRMEHANLRAFLFSDRSSWPDNGPSPVTIHRGRRFRWHEFAAVTAACAYPAAFMLVPDPESGGPDALGVVCFAAAAVTFAALLVRVYPGGRTPLMVLSPDGLHLPHRRMTVPWSAVAWADLTVRGRGMNENLALAWTLRPTSTIVIPVSWMVEDPEVALLASWRLAEAAR
jgi:hypothetical protein